MAGACGGRDRGRGRCLLTLWLLAYCLAHSLKLIEEKVYTTCSRETLIASSINITIHDVMLFLRCTEQLNNKQ